MISYSAMAKIATDVSAAWVVTRVTIFKKDLLDRPSSLHLQKKIIPIRTIVSLSGMHLGSYIFKNFQLKSLTVRKK